MFNAVQKAKVAVRKKKSDTENEPYVKECLLNYISNCIPSKCEDVKFGIQIESEV
jgi:hypothetical protein